MASPAIKKRRSGSIIYDPKIRGLVFQALVFITLAVVLWFIVQNTQDNLEKLNKQSGFGFLNLPADFSITTSFGTWLLDYEPGASTYWDVFLLSVVNTLVVAILGIIGATFIGFLMGVFRLSKNPVLLGFSTVYVELLRNVPLLLQIFFWAAIFRSEAFVPGKRESAEFLFGTAHFNVSGIWANFPVAQEGTRQMFAEFGAPISLLYNSIASLFGAQRDVAGDIADIQALGSGMSVVVLALLFAIFLAWLVGRFATNLQARTGKRIPAFWIGLALIIIIPLIAYYMMGQPLGWEEPNKGRFGFRPGLGMNIAPEFLALWVALTLYTGAFIAEIVRAGIMAVPHGQTEAAQALGVSPNVTLRKVIIPQAMRVIVPPLTSQYLNLTKNSSLAAAIGYPEVVAQFTGTALNQVGQEIEMVFMMMMVYLFFSISTALFMNWYNKRIQLVER